MRAKLVIFNIFMPKKAVCKLPFLVVKLMNISNSPEFNFKQFSAHIVRDISSLQ